MKTRIFQIDAFTNQLFGGNPAAVCPLQEWLPDAVLQKIALENNLSETAFFTPIDKQNFTLRWFTPEIEMDLCGHATLATGYVLFECLGYPYDVIYFHTNSGLLTVSRAGDLYELDLPSRPPKKAKLPKTIINGLNIQPKEVWKSRDYLLLYENESDIANLQPDIKILNQINIDPGGIVATAKGDTADFVSRFFTPQASIFEDPVTGSAHCTLVPFWAERLNKTDLHALQISPRGGELFCRMNNSRIYLRGRAVKYLTGQLVIDDFIRELSTNKVLTTSKMYSS